MTTIKEYKEMMEGATDGPWKLSEVMGHVMVRDANNETVVGFSTYGGDCRYLKNARLMTASRNIAPELIRVIELAEEALCARVDPEYSFDEDMLLARKALSEIRKLKGE